MSSNVRPASATAFSHASMVSDSGGTICRRPIFDMPMPVIAEWSSNFSLVSIGRTCLPNSSGGSGPRAWRSARIWSAAGLNTGSQTSVDLLERDLDGLAELEVVGVAVDDVGGQPNSRDPRAMATSATT